MAEAIVGPLLNKLQEVAVSEAKKLAALGREMDSLRDKLMWLQAYIHEIDLRSRHDGNHLIRVLARQMREVAFEAEDAVDRFYLQVAVSRFGHGRLHRVVAIFLSHLGTQLRVRWDLSNKVAALNVRLEEVIGNSVKYKLDGGVSGSSWRSSRAMPLEREGWDDSEQFVLKGRKDEQQKLAKLLDNTSTVDGHVIRVIGESGVGKRALVWDAYKNEKDKGGFVACIWISFPPDTSELTIVQLIYEELILECSMLHNDSTSHHLLQKVQQQEQFVEYKKTVDELLENKRYLVVIDSPISTTRWNKVRTALPNNGNGSTTVLMVTPSSSFSMEANDCIIKLRCLDKENSKTLFNDKIGLNGRRTSAYKVAQMNVIRDNIEEVTMGLPLAVVLLAKLLRTMELNKWELAKEYILGNQEDDRFNTILSLSIDDLADDLKSCLLYTAGFPEYTMIDARHLVRLWMAEGFVSPEASRMTPEHLGQRYLKELIFRGLVKLVKKSAHGDVELVAIHDRIHSFLRLEAQRTCFLDVHYGGYVQAPPGTVRRLSLQNYNDRSVAIPNRSSKLRTVMSHFKVDYRNGSGGGESGSLRKDQPMLDMRPLLQGSSYLCVIRLQDVNVGEKLPSEVGDLVHLQYLGVRCRSLKKLPDTVGNLSKLQTIDVRDTEVRVLPSSLWKIRTLRHVLGDGILFPVPKSPRHLRLLHTLESISVKQINGNDSHMHRTLLGRSIVSRVLHRLHVVGLDKSQRQALQDVLDMLTFLESLTLSAEDVEVIPLLDFMAGAGCLEHLVSLELNGKLQEPSSFGQGMRFFVNLTHLVLKSTHVDQDFINKLAALPLLADLMLLAGSYDGKELVVISHGFSSLKLLQLSYLVMLQRVVLQDNHATLEPKRIGMPYTTIVRPKAPGPATN